MVSWISPNFGEEYAKLELISADSALRYWGSAADDRWGPGKGIEMGAPIQTSESYVLHGSRDLKFEAERPLPAPGAGDVIVAVARVGICGSDLHYFAHGRCGAFAPDRPFVLGHEFAGTIVWSGDRNSGVKEGERVAVMPLLFCGACGHCLSGRTNICERARFFGSARVSPTDGAYSRYVVVPARNCHTLPDALGYDLAALLEPLSVCMHAATRAGDLRYKSVLVTGGGPIGQLLAMVVRDGGASLVALSDIRSAPLDFAQEHSADIVLNSMEHGFVTRAKDVSGGGFDVVIDASGATSAIVQGFELVRRGGTLVQVGTLSSDPVIPWNQVMTKELTVVGSFGFPDVFARAIQLAASGRLPLKELVSRVFPFHELPGALAAAMSDGVVKVQVAISDLA